MPVCMINLCMTSLHDTMTVRIVLMYIIHHRIYSNLFCSQGTKLVPMAEGKACLKRETGKLFLFVRSLGCLWVNICPLPAVNQRNTALLFVICASLTLPIKLVFLSGGACLTSSYLGITAETHNTQQLIVTGKDWKLSLCAKCCFYVRDFRRHSKYGTFCIDSMNDDKYACVVFIRLKISTLQSFVVRLLICWSSSSSN